MAKEKGKIISVNISTKRGEKKTPVSEIEMRVGYGMEGDAHAGRDPIRSVSLLAIESHRKMIAKGVDVKPGDFAENITTEGIVLPTLPIGTKMRSGDVEMEVTKIGKECHHGCEIFKQIGECVMPSEGIFIKVLSGGVIRPGDPIEVE